MRVCLLLSFALLSSACWAEAPSWTTNALAYTPTSPEQAASISSQTTSPASAVVEHITQLDRATVLAAHNPYRSELQLTPLVWSNELAKSAQEWVDHLAATNQFMHSNTEFGENLWRGTAHAYSPQQMIDAWGSEKNQFVYGIFPHVTKGGMVGHYTQLIWKVTYQVGCGIAKSGNKEYLACHYDPAGNYEDEAPY